MYRMVKYFLFIVTLVFLTACGGGSDNKSRTNTNAGTSSIQSIKRGNFSDIEGLQYKTSSGLTGITDKNGGFQYRDGDSIEFYIKGLSFGKVDAVSSIDATLFKKPELVLQALHALDSDGNLTNGISIDSNLIVKDTKYNKNVYAKTTETVSTTIKLDEIVDDDTKYIEFLKKNGKLLQSKQMAIIAELAREFELQEQKNPKHQKSKDFVDLIMTGGQYFPSYSRYNETIIKNDISYKLNDETDGNNYYYRVNNLVLYMMQNSILKENQNQSNTILTDQQAYESLIDTKANAIKYTIDSSFDIVEGLKSGNSKIKSLGQLLSGYAQNGHLEDTANYTIDTFFPKDMQDNAKISVIIAAKCSSLDKLKDPTECALNVIDNVADRIIKSKVKDEIGAVWIKGAKDIVVNNIKVYKECSGAFGKMKTKIDFSIPTSCAKEIANAAIKPIIDTSATILKMSNLGGNEEKFNSYIIAQEIFFTSKYYGVNNIANNDNQICSIASVYDNSKEFIQGCIDQKNRKAKIEYIADKIIKNNILQNFIDTPGNDYNVVDIDDYLMKLQSQYQGLFDVYSEELKDKYYNKSSDEYSWIYKQVKVDEPSISIQKEYEDGSADLRVCFDVHTYRAINNINASAWVIDKSTNTKQSIDIVNYTSRIDAGKNAKFCGHIDPYNNDIAKDTLLVVNNFSFKLEHYSGNSFSIKNFKLYNYNKVAIEKLPEVDFVSEYDPSLKSYYLKSNYMQGIDTPDGYYFKWQIIGGDASCDFNAEGTKGYLFYGDVEGIDRKCLSGTMIAKLNVYNNQNGSKVFIGSATHTLDPLTTPSLQTDKLVVSSSVTGLTLKAGETKEVELTIKGGLPPYKIELDNNNAFFKVEQKSLSRYLISSTGTSDVFQKSKITFSVVDNKGNSTQTDIEVSQLAKKEDAPLSLNISFNDTSSYYVNAYKFKKDIIKVGEGYIQKWAIINTSLETLHDVVLKPIFCSIDNTELIHTKDPIHIGDISPKEWVYPSLKITAPKKDIVDNYCQWDIYATKDGKEIRLVFDSGMKASVNYYLDVQNQKEEVVSTPVPQNLKAQQTKDGVLLSWDAVKNATSYTPMSSMDFTKDGNYMDISAGCEFTSKTSCLIPSSRFEQHKIWYFAVKANNSLRSDPVKFVWEDKDVDSETDSPIEPDSKYETYLKGQTLYSIKDGVITKWFFNDTLTEVHITKEDGSYDKSVLISLTTNGLEIMEGTSDTDYWVIKSIENDYLILESADITPEGVYLAYNGETKLYFDKPQSNNDNTGIPNTLERVELDQVNKIINSNSFILSWHSVKNSTFYEVEMSKDPEFNSNVQHFEMSNTSFKFDNLESGYKYYFRVRARTENVLGEWSIKTWVQIEKKEIPKFDEAYQKPENAGTIDIYNFRFAWNVINDDKFDLEYYVEVGESSDNLVYNSGWIKNNRVYWSDLSSKELKPNTTYYWRVLVREKGRDKAYYGGEYISSPVWKFTTANQGYDLSIKEIKLLDEIKPNHQVRVEAIIENRGNKTIKEFYAQLKFRKKDIINEFATEPMKLIEEEIQPGQSISIEFIADFRDEIIEKNGKSYDNVIEEGVPSALIVDLPYSNEDLNPSDNIKEYKFKYESKNLPVIKYFSVGPKSFYDDHKLYTSIGKVIGRLDGILFDVEDDIKVTKVTLEYQLHATDDWYLLKTYTNNDDSISDDFEWIVPNDKSFVTNEMRIRLRAYENDDSYSEKISYPFSVYDNNLIVNVGDISSHKIGDKFDLDLSINPSTDSKIRLIEIKLISNGYSEVLYSKIDNDGFDEYEPISLEIPSENKYASSNAQIEIRVEDTNQNSKKLLKEFELIENIDVDKVFSKVIKIYDEQYTEFPSDSTNQRTDNDIYKVILDDNNISHILVRSVAWWKNDGQNDMSRDFRYYYIKYDYNNNTQTKPKLLYRTSIIDDGNLPEELPEDFIVFNGKPYILTYTWRTSHELFVYDDNGKLNVSYSANDDEYIGLFKLFQYNNSLYLKYYSKEDDIRKLKIANISNAENAHTITDSYYGAYIRLHNNKIYFPSYAKALEIDDNLNIVDEYFDFGKQDIYLKGNVKNYTDSAFEIMMDKDKNLQLIKNDLSTEVLINIKDDVLIEEYGGYYTSIASAIYKDSILYIYPAQEEEGERKATYMIKYITSSGSIISNVSIGTNMAKSVPYNVSINKNKLVSVVNIDQGAAYLVIGDFTTE